MWDSPAFAAGLTSGALIERVNGLDYSEQAIGDAIEAAANGEPLRLRVRPRPQSRSRAVPVHFHDGHRFPHLEAVEGARRRLDEILAPR
jgi:predicted metalloprotease with PDZ domain